MHPNTIASFLLVQANVLLLRRLTSRAEVAQYQLAQQLALALILLPQSGAMILFGCVARIGPDGAWPQTRRLTFQMLTVMGSVALVAACVGPELVRAISGTNFEQAGSLLGWLLVVALGASLSERLTPQWFGRGSFSCQPR